MLPLLSAVAVPNVCQPSVTRLVAACTLVRHVCTAKASKMKYAVGEIAGDKIKGWCGGDIDQWLIAVRP